MPDKRYPAREKWGRGMAETTTVSLYFDEEEVATYIFEMDALPRVGDSFYFQSDEMPKFRVGEVKRLVWEVSVVKGSTMICVGLYVEEQK